MTYVTSAILVIGALIAYFQWRTAHQRVVLDLFERRLVVFNEIEEAARAILNATSRKERQDPYWRYIRAEAKARFLFGGDITELLKKHRKDIAAIMAFSEVTFQHREYSIMIDQMQRAEQNLASFLEDSASPFATYMRLDQKMPNLWWPSSPFTSRFLRGLLRKSAD